MATLRQKKDQLIDDLFFYVVSFGDIAANATATVSLQIQADSDFEWSKTTFIGSTLADPAPGGLVSLNNITFSAQITDGATGRKLQNIPTPAALLAGIEGLPFLNPASHIFTRNSNVLLSATETSGTALYFVTMLLSGRKLYNYKG